MDKNNNYKISVIISAYNTEDYLKEAIDSVIGQTIGFKENIQLILVNNASLDNLGEICHEYKEKYPDNIVYVELKENQGASGGRNAGLPYIKGEYVSFLDSDDKWDKNAFKFAFNFFDKHPDIKVVACRHYMFGRRNGFVHQLDYKYEKDKIVDIEKDYTYIQMGINNVILKRELLKGKSFDVSVKVGEDSKFVNSIIIDTGKYGVVRKAVYCYRKRESLDSAMDTHLSDPSWYQDNFTRFHMDLFSKSKKKYGKILPYFQYLTMYELQYRIKEKMPDTIDDEIRVQYRKDLISVLKNIDDSIIMEQKNINQIWKMYLFSLKHDENIYLKTKRDDQIFYFNDLPAFSVNAKNNLLIKITEIENNKLFLEGINRLSMLGEDYKFGILYDNKFVEADKYETPIFDIKDYDDNIVSSGVCFKLELPLKANRVFNFVLKTKDGDYIDVRPSTDKYSKLNRKLGGSYFASKDYIVKCRKTNFLVLKNTKINHLKSELRFDKALLKRKKIKFIFYRYIAKLNRTLKRKQIWILSDRAISANDNGEAMFKYIKSLNRKDINLYFRINKKSRDYKRMKKIGKVLKLNSFRYKIKFLSSDMIISSDADDYVLNAFRGNEKFFRDLLTFKFVFLQHGVLLNDLSNWLCKDKKNIKLFVTTTKMEYDSVVNGNYNYTKDVVKLTGLPRHDYLESDPISKIVILPTWRKQLSLPAIKGKGNERPISEKVKNSEYCTFYNKLINDERIIKVMKKHGYTGEFYMHPAFSNQYGYFEGNETIKVMDHLAKYKDIFRESKLLITDYSSTSIDFAYLKKPVVYAQFDKDDFFKGHSYEKGYFDYEKDGFGPVCNNYEETVKKIINYLEKGCQMEDKYKRRVNNFFTYRDKNNCARVYEEIVKINK